MDRAIPNHDLAAPVKSSEGRAKPPKLAFVREKFVTRKKSQKLKSIPVSQRAEMWWLKFKLQFSIQCAFRKSAMLGQCYLSPVREKGYYNTAIVNCLWVKRKVLLAEVFIVYERATKKLLFNRRNGYPQTYLYYYYLPPIKVLRIKLLLSWFPVYYPVTKNVRVSWKNLEQRKGPRKKRKFYAKFPTYG